MPEKKVEPKIETPVSKNEFNEKTPVIVKTHAEETKEILDKAPRTDFLIPLFEGENEGAVETCQINGYPFIIKKGVMVNIPVPVANLLAEKYRIAGLAGRDKRIDRNSETENALG